MRAALVLASLFALTACGGDPIIMVMDTGPRDAGSDVGNGGTDTGTPMADAGSCPPVMSPAPTGAVCVAATLTCLMGATTQTAQEACIAADPAAMACNTCLLQEVASNCTTPAAGCGDEFGLLTCCLQEECPTGDAACINTASMGACGTQGNAVNACFNTAQMARACGISMLCFMPAAAP